MYFTFRSRMQSCWGWGDGAVLNAESDYEFVEAT
eukprot:COSAG02_NODE_49641_length_325_cov_1.132743_1_plen_33_part_10